MLWQQKFFASDPFSRPSRLGQTGGTCSLNPDGTSTCSVGTMPPPVIPPVVTPVPAPTIQVSTPAPASSSNLLPLAIGGAGLLALVVLLARK